MNSERKKVEVRCLQWLVFLGFIFLAGDWSWLWERVSTDYTNPKIIPGTRQYQTIIGEVEAIESNLKKEAESGPLDLRAAIRKTDRVSSLCAKIDLEWGGRTRAIYEITRENYLRFWEPNAGDADLVKRGYPRDGVAGSAFQQDYNDARFQVYDEDAPLKEGIPWLGMFLWLAKWYWFLTIPISVILVLESELLRGESVTRRISGLGWRSVGYLAMGPMGLVPLTENAGLLEQYILIQKERRDLTVAEVWELVAERFGRSDLRRPIVAYSISCLIALLLNPLGRLAQPVAKAAIHISACADSGEQAQEESPPGDSILLVAILPDPVLVERVTSFVEMVAEGVCPRPMELVTCRRIPRGPPSAERNETHA